MLQNCPGILNNCTSTEKPQNCCGTMKLEMTLNTYSIIITYMFCSLVTLLQCKNVTYSYALALMINYYGSIPTLLETLPPCYIIDVTKLFWNIEKLYFCREATELLRYKTVRDDLEHLFDNCYIYDLFPGNLTSM